MCLFSAASCRTGSVERESREYPELARRTHAAIVSLRSARTADGSYTGNVTTEANSLKGNLDAIDPGLAFSIIHWADSVFLAGTTVGKSYGCVTNGVSKHPPRIDGSLWVLPLPNLGPPKALVAISTTAPKQTTLLLVDEHMQVQLVYDSYSKPQAGLEHSPSGPDYICGFTILGGDRFLMHELWIPGISQAALEPRTFVLAVMADGSVEIMPVAKAAAE